jgi:hypothetical protein
MAGRLLVAGCAWLLRAPARSSDPAHSLRCVSCCFATQLNTLFDRMRRPRKFLTPYQYLSLYFLRLSARPSVVLSCPTFDPITVSMRTLLDEFGRRLLLWSFPRHTLLSHLPHTLFAFFFRYTNRYFYPKTFSLEQPIVVRQPPLTP